MSYRLAVDLGTTYTAAAVSRGETVEMVGLGNRSLQVPSVVFWGSDGFLIGEPAERRGAADPSRVAREFKRRLGDHVPVLVGGSPFSAESLMAKLLSWVVDRTAERMGEPPAGLVLTHPANWGPYKLDVFRQVVVLADRGAAELCPEPVAAAAQYATRAPVDVGSRLAIYDFGGGTFDACVVERTPDGFHILGVPAGVEHLGGVDLDEALFEHVLGVLDDRGERADFEDPSTVAALARLRRECVEAKEALSSDVDTVLGVALPGRSTTVRVTRPDFEALIRPAVAETLTATRRALASASVEPGGLAAIVMVGGSSRIPLVTEVLQREFGVRVAMDTHPKHDVALGAARMDALAARRLDSAAAPAPAPSTRAAGPVSGPPPPPPRDLPDRPTDHAGQPRPGRTRLLIIGVVATLVALGVIAALLWPRNDVGPAVSPSTPPPSPTEPPIPVLPQSAELTPSQLLVPMQVDGAWNIYLGDTKDQAPGPKLTTVAGANAFPVLSPDLRTMIYTHEAPDGARTLRVAGAADGSGDQTLFSSPPPGCEGRLRRPAWSRVDPTLLAIACDDAEGRNRLLLVRTNGFVVGEVATGQARVDDPTFSPDGTELAFWAGPETDFDGGSLYVASLTTDEAPRPLTSAELDGQDSDPAWSPDGSTIAFRRRVADQAGEIHLQIFVMAPDGSREPAPITSGAADSQDPSWATSGRALAYRSTVSSKAFPDNKISRVWLMNKDGTDKNILWTEGNPTLQSAPSWSAR